MFDSFFTKNYNLALIQFCNNNNGKYFEGKYWKKDAVIITYNNYNIIFYSYIHYAIVSNSTLETEFLRVQLEFDSPDKLSFKVQKKGLIETVQKLFGGQDINIGSTPFNKKYVIQGNNIFKVITIFSNVEIQNLIELIGSGRIEILENEDFFGDPIKEGHSLLNFTTDKEPNDSSTLEHLLQLFKLIINNMQILGSANPLKNDNS
jgi:hypothetical protein